MGKRNEGESGSCGGGGVGGIRKKWINFLSVVTVTTQRNV